MNKIGNVLIENPCFLAPMAGITDGPFRRICREFGAGLLYSEMISAKGLYYNDKATEKLLKITDEEKPIAYQIFGSDPDFMAFAAKKLEERENVILDINMGCPVQKVVKNGEGSALLKNLNLASDVIKATVKATVKPVTVKIRIGWDEKSINAVETAVMAEESGAAAIAVHGRTRDQFYEGKANWKEIAKVKAVVKIPVIGNGDIFSKEDAYNLREETGCDFVMVGRGALGNPWLFKEIKEDISMKEKVDLSEKKEIIIKHLKLLVEEKGEYAAVREMRKHIGWYFKGIHNASEVRRKSNTLEKEQDIIELLEKV